MANKMAERYPVEPWMAKFLPMFHDTGGNDVVELLHDDETTAFNNVIRYTLIVSVRAQYTLLKTLHSTGLAQPCCCECGSCGDDVVWRPDPFAEEIHGDSTHYWLCDNCHHNACQEI